MSVILVVDDVAPMAQQYAYDLERLGGHRALTAGDGGGALEALRTEPVDCVLLDLEMPGMDGFEFLEQLRKEGLDAPVIVYTGTGNYDRCVRAVQLGASAFLDKSEAMERVVHEVERAIARHRLDAEVRTLREQVGEDTPLLGRSAAMRRLRESIARLAAIPSPVLILGESGSGKELVARELHRQSPRRSGPFFPINCAALPEGLVESELFGHEAGAFTGAARLRRGAFEAASRGTLFLDEVGELPAAAQGKLLRVLEDGRVPRVGGDRLVEVDARIVAATHRDLDEDAAAGGFRRDLLYRLNVHIVRVPPLRERSEDIPELCALLLERIAARVGMRPKALHADAAVVLSAYDWRRNNVRELRNTLERMLIASDGAALENVDVPEEIRAAAASGGGRTTGGSPAAGSGPGAATSPSASAPVSAEPSADPSADSHSLRELRDEAERRIVLEALERNDGQITRTAADLGLTDHSSLLKVMRRLGIRRPRGSR